MTITEILSKVGKSEDLTAEEKEWVKNYKEPSASDGQAVELQKKIDALAKDKDELQKKIDALAKDKDELQKKIDAEENAKLSDVEKLNKQVADLTKQLSTVTSERDHLQADNAAMSFDHGVEKLAREHKFTDPDFLKFKIQGAKLDLTQPEKVKEFMVQLKKDAPKFFEAAVNSGGGGTPAANSDLSGKDNRVRLDEIMKKENPTATELAEAMRLSAAIKAADIKAANQTGDPSKTSNP